MSKYREMASRKETKLRLIIDGVNFYSTVGQVLEGIGEDQLLNEAVRATWVVLANMCSEGPMGILTTESGYKIQIDFCE